MKSSARKFKLKDMRSNRDIVIDATGRVGWWPFAYPISFHVGINCDAIVAAGNRLNVLRHGEVIAFADLTPAPEAGQGRPA